MASKKLLKTYALIFLLGLLAVSAIYASQTIDEEELSSEDSSAIYGGEVEKGYPTAGYLVSEQPNGVYNYCSIVNVKRGIALTAAHCIENTKRIKIGFDSFTFGGNNNLVVTKIYRSSEWEGTNLGEDFAVIEYTLNNERSRPNAAIKQPTNGCNYEVVGYGRTEEDEVNFLESRPRKSAQVCINEVQDGTFTLTGLGGGICIGDSGSPIYIQNTDTVVGIVSSIITTADSKNQPCYIGNQAVAVRTDVSYGNFKDFSSNKLDTEDQFVVSEVTQATDLFDDFVKATGTEEVFATRENVLLFGGIIVGSLTLLMFFTQLLKRRH